METEMLSLLIPVGWKRVYSLEGPNSQRLGLAACKNSLNDGGRQAYNHKC